MHDSSLVAVEETLKDLKHQVLDHGRGERPTILVQVLLQIKVEILEDQVEFIAFWSRPMHYILELHYIRVS